MKEKLYNEVKKLVCAEITESEIFIKKRTDDLTERRYNDVMKRIKEITDKIGKFKEEEITSYSLMRIALGVGGMDSSIEGRLKNINSHISALHEQIELLHKYLNVQPAKTVERKYLKHIVKTKSKK
jgi:hypothetical protein